MSTAARVSIVNTWNAYRMAYNNHLHIYSKHNECLNTSWLTTIMSTAERVPIVNTWNA